MKITGIKNCGFQYYDGIRLKVNETLLSLQEAKDLWEKWYDDCVEKLEYERPCEMCIWVDMKDPNTYDKTLEHISYDCIVKEGVIYKPIQKKL